MSIVRLAKDIYNNTDEDSYNFLQILTYFNTWLQCKYI